MSKSTHTRYDEANHSEPWKNDVAKELNILTGRAEFYECEPDMLPCDKEVADAIHSIVERVATFEDIEPLPKKKEESFVITGPCVYCNEPSQGNYSIHRDGFAVGPEVPLCDRCGSGAEPTLNEIWAFIRGKKSNPTGA